MQIKAHLIFILLFSFSSPAYSISDPEKLILNAVQLDLPQATQDLETVVNINSGTMNFTGVEQIGDFFKHKFQQLDFETQWVPGSAFQRAGHLIASYGNVGPKILIIGHLDTVFSIEDSFQKYSPISSAQVKGPGITDMKGGNIILLYALKALKETDQLDKLQVRVVLTGDEESSGTPLSLSKKAIIDAAKWADIAIGFEDGDGNIKTAVTSRRGASNWMLSVTGRPAHSSQIWQPANGDGAIFETARILSEFKKVLEKEKNLTLNPGIIAGGTNAQLESQTNSASAFGKTNVIAQTTVVKGDIRAVSPQQLKKAQRLMKEIVSKNLPHTSANIEFKEGYPPMAPTKGNLQLLALYSQVSEELGYGKVEPVDPRKAGAADISFAAEHVDMALDGLGLMGTGGHTSEETADMTSFQKNMEKAALLMYRLSIARH